jgi:hypothetical protein
LSFATACAEQSASRNAVQLKVCTLVRFAKQKRFQFTLEARAHCTNNELTGLRVSVEGFLLPQRKEVNQMKIALNNL